MKKHISLLAALAVCVSMFAACGGEDDFVAETTEAEITSREVPSITLATTDAEETTTEETTEETTEPVTEATTTTATTPAEEITLPEGFVTEENNGSSVVGEFADIDEFLAADIESLANQKVKLADSNMLAFVKMCSGLTEFYIDMTLSDQNGIYATSGGQVYCAIKGGNEDGSDLAIIIKDDTAYMLFDSMSIAVYMPADESTDALVNAFNFPKLVTDAGLDEALDNPGDAEISTCKVKIGGTVYIYEGDGKTRGLFHENGGIYTVISGNEASMYINELTEDVPMELFEIPSDYVLMSYDDLMNAAG